MLDTVVNWIINNPGYTCIIGFVTVCYVAAAIDELN